VLQSVYRVGAMALLREGLLEGRVIAAAGLSEELAAGLRRLGAEVRRLDAEAALEGIEEQVGEWARAKGPLHALVCDTRPVFGPGGRAALLRSQEQAWIATREVAVGALIPGAGPGRIILIAPQPDAGTLAGAARAGLENLARTLSVEWARFDVTVVALAPGAATSEAHVADLVSFVCSPAGGYFSGCRIELGVCSSSNPTPPRAR